ncbi:MAG: glycoside hydrolase family 13 protein, partial [Eubacterium sp.]|nr:glycoside hydrolase family 13 protein [Eubacterium sp.]
MSTCTIVADGRSVGKKTGTVRLGEEFEIYLKVPRRLAATEIELFICSEEGERLLRYPMDWCDCVEDLDVFHIAVPTTCVGLYWFHFEADTWYGRQYSYKDWASVNFSADRDWMTSLQLTVYDRQYSVPEFIRGGLFYQVFVDRFCRGRQTAWRDDSIKSRYRVCAKDEPFDNVERRSIVVRDDWGGEPVWEPDSYGEILNNDFFGGNLRGVIDKLPYLEGLGVTCIYLSPIFESYSSHKYDTGDYMKIDAMFGDEGEFAELCKLAKKRGISVILDGVFNHTGADSIYFNKYGIYDGVGAWQSEESGYRHWYDFEENGEYRSWWGIDTLPAVNKDAAEYHELLFGENGVIRKYLRLGAAGWRLDVVDEVPDDFVVELVAAAKAEREDAIVLGEVWEDASNKIAYGVRRRYFLGEELDSVMNYPWKDAIIEYLKSGDALPLAMSIEEICAHYPPEV